MTHTRVRDMTGDGVRCRTHTDGVRAACRTIRDRTADRRRERERERGLKNREGKWRIKEGRGRR